DVPNEVGNCKAPNPIFENVPWLFVILSVVGAPVAGMRMSATFTAPAAGPMFVKLTTLPGSNIYRSPVAEAVEIVPELVHLPVPWKAMLSADVIVAPAGRV